jgi:tetratricopeptide (TPR) repeat protein
MSTVQKRNGHLGDAMNTLDRAAALAAAIKARVPAAWHQRTMGMIWLTRSDVEYRRGDYAAAERAAGAALNLYTALEAAPVLERKEADPIFTAMAAENRGVAFRELKEVPKALSALDDSVARLEVLARSNKSRDVRHNLNRCRLNRAITRPAAAATDASRELAEVIGDADKLATEYASNPYYKEVLAEALIRRADLISQTAHDQAAAHYDRAAPVTRELLDRYGNQPDHIGLRGRMFRGKGRLLASQGKKPDAGIEFGNAVKTFRIAVGRDPDNAEFGRLLKEATAEAERYPAPTKR